MKRKNKTNLAHWSAADLEGKFVDQYDNEVKESFARISESLMESLAFRKLNHTQQVLLLCCEQKAYGHIKPCNDKNHPEYEHYKNRPDTFYITKDDVYHRYGIYRMENSLCDFYRKDLPALESHGFIKKLWSGKGRQKSIYCFSDDWITWQPEAPPT